MKFATKPVRHYPPHLRHVATLPLEIKKSNFLQKWNKMQTNCIFIASNFFIHPQILISLVFKIVNCFQYWLQMKFSMPLFFCLLIFAINLWHQKFITANVTSVFVNKQHDIQRRGQDFDKNTYIQGGPKSRTVFWQFVTPVYVDIQ